MPTPTETWQDRRGMFQRGKDVHQPGRKLSNQFGDPLAGRRTSIGSTGSVGLEKTDSIEEPGAQRRRVSSACCRCCRVSYDSMREGDCVCSRRCRRCRLSLSMSEAHRIATTCHNNPRIEITPTDAHSSQSHSLPPPTVASSKTSTPTSVAAKTTPSAAPATLRWPAIRLVS